MKKKLAILINSMNGGGAERVVSILLEDLIKYYEVHLVIFYAGMAYKIPQEVKIHYLAKCSVNDSNLSKVINLPILGYKYYKYCKKHKIDISLSLLNRANYINILSKYFGAPYKTIISERTSTVEAYRVNSVKGRISRLLVKCLYPSTDSIIAISKGVAADLSAAFKIKRSKIRTIYNPINLDWLHAEYSTISKVSNNCFTFIAIGRLDEQKNFQLLLEALSILKHFKIKLVILGDGPQRENLIESIKQLELEDKVTLIGFTNDVFSYLKNADCFVMPSNLEGLGNVIIEALACGKAVISTDCKHGPSEILAGNIFPTINNMNEFQFAKYGILVPVNNAKVLANAMQEMILNDNKRSAYEQLGPERASHFNKDIILSQYLDMLEEPPT